MKTQNILSPKTNKAESKNKTQWFIANSPKELTDKTASEQWGTVYAVEYGEHVKVGYTKDLIKRVKNFLHLTSYNQIKIGKIAYTLYHSNFTENEKILHKAFKPHRTKGTELFDITLEDFLKTAPQLQFDEVVFDYATEVKALKEAIEQRQNGIVPTHTSLITIDDKALPAREYKGERVITFKDVDYIHSKPKGFSKKNFYKSKTNFIEGVDYFDIKQSDFLKYQISTLEIPNRGLTFLTKMGYMMLVKSFNDQLSWLIQRQLVMKYFDSRPDPNAEIGATVINLVKNMANLTARGENNMMLETSFINAVEEKEKSSTVRKSTVEDGLKRNAENLYANIIPSTEGKVNTFRCNIDKVAYKNKESAKKDTTFIVNRTKQESQIKALTPLHLSELVTNGYSFTTAALKGTKEKDFVSQQLAVLDIDNSREDVPITTVEDAVKVLAEHKIDYSFMYYSFSHSDALPKFRIVCVLSEAVTEPQRAKELNKYLISLFPQSDPACHNLDRFYYGTDKGLATEVHNRTTTITVPEIFNRVEIDTFKTEPPQENTPPISEPKPQKAAVGQFLSGESLGQAIRDFNLLEYVEQTTGTQGIRKGKDVLFNPCPLCGHQNDFYIDTDRNLYKCHGASNGTGGNIINYLMQRDNLSKTNATRRFKYDIMGTDEKAEKEAFKKAKRAEREQNGGNYEDDLSKRPYIYTIEKVNKQTGEVTKKLQLDRPKFAEYFRKHIPFFFTENIGYSDIHMYIYADGVYKMRHPNYIKAFIENMLPLELRLPEISNKLYEALTHDLRYTKYENCNPETYINFKNGLYNIETEQIEPHNPKVLSTIQIPISYNPKIDYSEYQGGVFDTFINHHLGGDKSQTQLILEFMGVTLSNIPVHRYKKSLLIIGAGNTGKTQLRKLIELLIGSENCHNVELGKMENNRFEAANLYNKRLSGSPDMSFMNVQELLIYKQLTGGDRIGAEFKGRSGFNFIFNGLLWYCANELPKFGGDKGDHTYERFCIVRAVGKTHKKGEQSINGSVEADPILIDKMYNEAPYIIYKALQALKVLIENEKFSETEKQRQELNAYKKSNSSIAEFVEECVTERPSEKIEDKCNRAMINKVYVAWCKENGKYYEGKTKLFEYLVSIGGKEGLKDGIYYFKNYTLSKETKREFYKIYGFDTVN